MATLVLTVIGDDQAGLVDVLSGVVADHGGNWDKSHMAQLGGKFAGIVMVAVPDQKADALIKDLRPLEAQGLLDVTVERVGDAEPAPELNRLSMEVVGLDHPGIVHDISHALAERGVSIEELHTETTSAPMAGGMLFHATAFLQVPVDVPTDELIDSLEELASELMVDIELTDSSD